MPGIRRGSLMPGLTARPGQGGERHRRRLRRGGRAPRPGAEIARGAKRVVERTQAPRDAARGRVLIADAPGDPGHPGRQIVQRLLDVPERVTEL